MFPLDPNRYAAPAEAALLREHIAADEAAHPALRQRLSRAKTALYDAQQALLAARELEQSAQHVYDEVAGLEADLEERLARVRGLMHPLRRFPDELLAMLLRFWHDSCETDSDKNQVGTYRVPYYAASVCRRWRRIALHTSSLWRVINLSMNTVTFKNVGNWIRYIETHATRSRMVPLELSVSGRVEQEARAIWVALLLVTKRCRSIWIDVFGPELLYELYSCFCQEAPLLEEIYFHFDATEITSIEMQSLQFFTSAPLLKSCQFLDPEIVWPSPLAVYSNVTVVEVWTDRFNLEGLVELIHHMPNIQKLKASISYYPAVTISDRFSLQSAKLEEIELHVGGFEASVLSRIHFPSLRTAIIEDNTRHSPTDLCFTALLQHPLRAIEELTISVPVDGTLVEGLWFLGNLHKLYFTQAGYADDAEELLDALSRLHGQRGWLCPSLRVLGIGNSVPRASLCEAIVRLARARGPFALSAERPPLTMTAITLLDNSGPVVASVQSQTRLMVEELEQIFGPGRGLM